MLKLINLVWQPAKYQKNENSKNVTIILEYVVKEEFDF